MSSTIKSIVISSISTETADAKTFVVKFPDDWFPVYHPGQFITLVFYTKHGEKRRSYSISSATDEPFAFTVKKVENGEFSRYLLSKVKVDDILYTSGVSGLFLLPADIDYGKQYFFLAAGSGITPCFSMIKTILMKGTAKVVLIYSNRTEDDCIFHRQLQVLEEKFKERFSIYFLFSEISDIYRSRLSKWLLQQLLVRYLIVPAVEALFYMCGPVRIHAHDKHQLTGKHTRKKYFQRKFQYARQNRRASTTGSGCA